MAQRQLSRFCATCDRQTLHAKEIFGMTWGCLFTILTAGLFLPLWILVDVFGALKPYRCQSCGGKRWT